LDFGLVAKINLMEVRAPVIQASLVYLLTLLQLIAFDPHLFWGITAFVLANLLSNTIKCTGMNGQVILSCKDRGN